MKKIKLVSLLSMVILTIMLIMPFSKVNAYSETGHRNFEEIYLPEGRGLYLLKNSSPKRLREELRQVKWRFFGPSVHVTLNSVRVGYKKNNVFCRSNKTSNVLEYEYKYTSTLKSKISSDQKYVYDLSAKVKINIVDAAIEESISNAINLTTESSTTKEVNYTITVDPYTKVTVYITGEALLSQGAVKYYMFGIPLFQSNWEVIDVITEYYEFYEEVYK